MNSKQKIFITGASSELMKNLISLLNKEEYEIFCLSRNTYHTEGENIYGIKGDILEIHKFKEQIKSCDIIIHAAAVTHTSDKKKYYEINLDATKKLVDIAVEYKIKKFIFISSRAADIKNGAYGESKIRAEEYIKQNIENYLIFRPAEIFGGSKNEGIQKMFSDIKTKKYIICPLNVPKLYPVSVDDTIQIIYDFSFIKNTANQTVIINGNKGYSYVELTKLTAKIFRKKIRIIPVPKFIMLFMKIFLETFKINIGIAPDQISRLYGKKEIQNLNYRFTEVEDYLKNFKS